MPRNFIPLFLGITLFLSVESFALQIFAKASASKSNINANSYMLSISGSAGFAFELISQINFEARYSNFTSLQNSYPISAGGLVGTLTDEYVDTHLVSVGLTIDIVDEKNTLQPYIYVGVGYLMTHRQSYYTPAASSTTFLLADPDKSSYTGNAGVGFRIRIAKSMAIELEAVGYVANVTQPNPLIDIYASAGVRIFL